MKNQNVDNFLNIPRFIFWIDKNIKTEENQGYLNNLKKEFSSYSIQTFGSIDAFEDILKKKKQNMILNFYM